LGSVQCFSPAHRADRAAVDDRPALVEASAATEFGEQRLVEPLPDAGALPPDQAAPTRTARPAAHLVGQHLPGNAGPEDEQDAGQNRAVGNRRPTVPVAAPNRRRHLANRELGTLERIDADERLQIRLDSGRTTRFRLGEHPHLDYGYAVTRYSSQGRTADRVLIHIDTTHAGEALVNRRLAYVAVSRARHDVHIYTNDKAQLMAGLQRDVSQRSAVEATEQLARHPHSQGLGR
jgi:hypothetical protein